MPLISSHLQTVHIVGTVLITLFGALGCGGPVALSIFASHNRKVVRYLSFVQLLLTSLGAGVVICTALVHILPDGMDSLASGGLGGDSSSADATDNVTLTLAPVNGTADAAPADDGDAYPYGPMLMLVGMLVTYVIDSELHKLASAQQEATMKAHVTEIGIAVHSVLVGVAYGAMTTIDSLNTLTIALLFHQLCEGFALAPLVVKGTHSTLHTVALIAVFALSLPAGIGIGSLALKYGNPDSKEANLSQGILSCLAAGMLMYVGAVEFLGGLQHSTDGHTHCDEGDEEVVLPSSISPGEEGQLKADPTLSDESPCSPAGPNGEPTPLSDREDTHSHDHTSTFLSEHPVISRLLSHLMTLVGGAAMSVIAMWA